MKFNRKSVVLKGNVALMILSLSPDERDDAVCSTVCEES